MNNIKASMFVKNAQIWSGKKDFSGDSLAILNDKIIGIGKYSDISNLIDSDTNVIDAKGMAITPGFINMLSWAPVSLIIDGNSQGDIRQGVTLEVFGEGGSMGPLNAKMKAHYKRCDSCVQFVDLEKKKGLPVPVT
jgi:N-acyl-D-amino-acid deacylase